MVDHLSVRKMNSAFDYITVERCSPAAVTGWGQGYRVRAGCYTEGTEVEFVIHKADLIKLSKQIEGFLKEE